MQFRTFLWTGAILCASAALAAGEPPAPGGRPDDPSVWPNRTSFRNSDPWLVENHEKIRKMRPRVLVLNFANDVDPAGIEDRTRRLIAAIAESTRYRGFEDPKAPAFLEYEVARYVDLRDENPPEDLRRETSTLFPRKPRGAPGVLCDYSKLYGPDFARRYGFRDPGAPDRFLDLHELIERGIVHELWFWAVHGKEWPGHETIEFKQYYDERARPIEGRHGPAGNGHDPTMPWSGRSFRIAFLNPHRGVGCAMENFGHTLEYMAHADTIGYFTKYFREFAELDLDRRYGLPFASLYALGPDDRVSYPEKDLMRIVRRGREHVVRPYVAAGGNVHFPPGARRHYDLESPYAVLSTIESYRLRNGPDGKDAVREFSKAKWERCAAVAPDCMGPWVVFWRQCMPGLDNRALDDEGRPMKNWWVFLFY